MIIFVKHTASYLVYPKAPNGSDYFTIKDTSNDANQRSFPLSEMFHVGGLFINMIFKFKNNPVKNLSCFRVSAMGKFTMNLVRLRDDNGMFLG